VLHQPYLSLCLADVQDALDAALSDGATNVTIYIPASSPHPFVWSNGASLFIPDGTTKNIRLIGSGQSTTEITHFRIRLPANGVCHIVEFAHMTVDGNGTSGAMMSNRMRAGTPGKVLYWHDFTMKDYNAVYNLHLEGWLGVISGITMIGVDKAGQSDYGITFHGDGQYSDHKADLGTANAMFVEDSSFTDYGHSISLFCDAFVVFRYNIVDNADAYVDIHGPGYNACCPFYPGVSVPNDEHGGGGFEVYNNIFRNYEGAWHIAPRAGTAGIITSNVIESGGSYAVALQVQETCTASTNCGGAYPCDRVYTVGSDGCLQMIENWWVWDNTATRELYVYERPDCADCNNENEHYWNRAPQTGDPVASWTPYAYPHPLRDPAPAPVSPPGPPAGLRVTDE